MNTKKYIIQEALKLFLQNGYDKTSINLIAKECELTKGALYHHFKNKDEIFIFSIDLFYEKLDSWLKQRVKKSSSIKDFLWIFFDYSEYFIENPVTKNYHQNSYRLIFDGIKIFPEMRQMLVDKFKKYDTFIQNKIIKAQKEKFIKTDIDPETLSTEVFVMFEGFLLLEIAFNNNFSLENRKIKIFNNLWNKIKI